MEKCRVIAVVETILKPSYNKAGNYDITVVTDQKDVMIRYLLISYGDESQESRFFGGEIDQQFFQRGLNLAYFYYEFLAKKWPNWFRNYVQSSEHSQRAAIS